MKTGRMSCRWVVGFIAFVNVLALGPGARADLGDKGTISVSVDRLFGFNQIKRSESIGNSSASETVNVFSLFIPAIGAIFAAPRLALDVPVVNNVTVGGAVGIVIAGGSGSQTVAGFTTDTGGGSGNGFLLAPRAGFILPAGSSTKVWVRGGLTYFRTSNKEDGSNTESTLSGLALNLEPTLVFPVASHVGFSVGAVIDLPLSGEAKTTNGTLSVSKDMTFRNLGVVAGLALTL
jgi:hypothetical protein